MRCPECGGGGIWWSYTCHTYSIGAGEQIRWDSCLPCDTAVSYLCANEQCDWQYTHGLNPGNPRAAANETHRPSWLPAKLAHDELGIALVHPDVASPKEPYGHA